MLIMPLLVIHRLLVLLVLQECKSLVVLFLLVRGSTISAVERLPELLLLEDCSLRGFPPMVKAVMTLILMMVPMLQDVRDRAKGRPEFCLPLLASTFPLASLFTMKMVLL
jgi:hypothetical protein